jgi:hypothetical protein
VRRWRNRTIHVARLDRVMAESDAVLRAMKAGAADARAIRSERIVDDSGTPVWEVVVRVLPPRQVPNRSARRDVRKK